MFSKNLAFHIQVVGWLHIISNAIMILIGLFALFFLPTLGWVAQDPIAVRALSAIGLGGALFFVLLALPGILAGYGLLAHKSWARVLGLIVGFLSLINFPLGTIIGIYTVVVLLQDEAEEYFAPLKMA